MAVPFWAEVVAFRGSNFSQQAMCDALKAEKHQAESPESFRDRMLQVQEEFPEHLGVEGSPGRGEVEAAPSCHVTSTGPKCYFQGVFTLKNV